MRGSMRTIASGMSAAFVLAILAAGPSAHAGASFQGLGDLPGGDFLSKANAVSADGSVVVGTSNWYGAAPEEAFRWTQATGMVGLGDLPGGIFMSRGDDVSADGSVVVGEARSSAVWEAFRWTASDGMVSVGGGEAYGVSADGSVVVGWSLPGPQAFRWSQATGMVSLGTLPGAAESFASAASADGSVVVGFSPSPAYQGEAFRWTQATGMVGLGFLGGDDRSSAHAVSADGSVVVGSTLDSFNWAYEAFRWTQATGMVGLGLVPGASDSSARDVSADGSVVVGSSGGAFIWDANHGMRSLQDLLVNEFGLDLGGWTLGSADGISADGLTIVGTGTNPQGDVEAWRAVIPEPASALVLILGVGALIRRRRGA